MGEKQPNSAPAKVFMAPPGTVFPGILPDAGSADWVEVGTTTLEVVYGLPTESEEQHQDVIATEHTVTYEFRTTRKFIRNYWKLEGVYRLPGDKTLIHNGRRNR